MKFQFPVVRYDNVFKKNETTVELYSFLTEKVRSKEMLARLEAIKAVSKLVFEIKQKGKQVSADIYDFKNKLKKDLPCIEPSNRTGLCFIDMDRVTDKEKLILVEEFKKLPYVLCIQDSVSETGIHIIVKLSGIDNYKLRYQELYFELTDVINKAVDEEGFKLNDLREEDGIEILGIDVLPDEPRKKYYTNGSIFYWNPDCEDYTRVAKVPVDMKYMDNTVADGKEKRFTVPGINMKNFKGDPIKEPVKKNTHHNKPNPVTPIMYNARWSNTLNPKTFTPRKAGVNAKQVLYSKGDKDDMLI